MTTTRATRFQGFDRLPSRARITWKDIKEAIGDELWAALRDAPQARQSDGEMAAAEKVRRTA